MSDVAECRSCGSGDLNPFLSLGKTPLADALVKPGADFKLEERFALDVAFCATCSLVQLLEEVPADKMFVDNYLYFSSFSDELLRHSRENVLRLIAERQLGPDSLVVEIASNDGYLLKNFAEFDVPVLGVDPAPDQAAAANAAGIPTLARFFGSELAAELVAEGKRADVIIANNVMAHVPGLNDVMAGVATLLADDGVVVIENPYVRDLIDHVEFDTIYHEHLCYHSCTAIDHLAARHGLTLNHVENFPRLHGGTLRWHLSRRTQRSAAANAFLESEKASGLDSLAYYQGFAQRVEHVRTTLHALIEGLRKDGKTVAAYGAAAKGATLVNTVGLDTDLVEFVVDRNVHKQGLLMPGTHQPILDPAALVERRPDYVLLLAWNFKDEIIAQQQEYVALGGQFIVPVPEPMILTGSRDGVRPMSRTDCPACSSTDLRIFHEQLSIPVNSCLLLDDADDARAFPRGDLVLAFCRSCGFIFNTAFDIGQSEYSARYEETQGFSPRFRDFAQSLAEQWVARHGLNGKSVLEIGCGKGEFLVEMIKAGAGSGIGIDPSFRADRMDEAMGERIEWIADFYGENYSHLIVDAIVCRHTLEHIAPVGDFVGMIKRTIQNPETVVLFELPDVARVLEEVAFWDIYYEHCSYFSLGSMARLFRRNGFDITDLATEFDDQYLLLDCVPGTGTNPQLPGEDDLARLEAGVDHFEKEYPKSIAKMRSDLRTAADSGRKAVIWGAGSKGVSYLTTLGLQDEIGYAVDINPFKQGMFMAGTGQEVVGPDFLRDYDPDLVVAMNSIYLDEIRAELDRIGVGAELVGA